MDSKRKPFAELKKGFKLELVCEECGLQTNTLYAKPVDGMLLCRECAEIHNRRVRLKQADEEFGDV